MDKTDSEGIRGMTSSRNSICATAIFLLLTAGASAQAPRSEQALQPDPATLDEAAPPGANYDKAEFRFWAPDGVARLDGILVLNPGSNGEGRQMASDPVWRQWAAGHGLAIVATHLTDKSPSFVEDYADVSKGSGPALMNAIDAFAKRSKHPELATAPLVLWGMSAGGEVNYELAAWKPERIAAFVVNKGNFYYTCIASKATRAVPALLFVGNDDLQYRITAVTGIFAMNRRPGALWALVQEPNTPHAVGRSDEMSRMFFDDVLPLRMAPGSSVLKPLDATKGWQGDLATHTVAAIAPGAKMPEEPTVWLPTERMAKAWVAVENGAPFEK
jgi:poly(3-hydroxybutyrate) depolymerase